MGDITDRDMLRLDLNLLKALAVLVQERSVTQAALRLCVTQSAASNMLARLRRTLGDPILVRAGNAMVPTERATHAAGAVWQHIEAITGALTSLAAFEPRRTERQFRIAMPDYLAQILIPAFSRRFAAEAPGAQLVVRHANAENYRRLLDEGEADVVVSMLRGPRPHHRTIPLAQERFVCLEDADERGDEPLTLAAYLARSHVFVSFTGDLGGAVDERLARLGHGRRIAVAAPSFGLVPELLKGTAYLAAVPSPFARYCKRAYGLRAVTLPFELDPIAVSMAWHRRTDLDPAFAWFRAAIASVASREPDLQEPVGSPGTPS